MTGPAYDAVVLAGGGARRLGGVDKPAQQIGGRSLLDRVLGAVPDAGTTVVVGPVRSTCRPVLWTREQPPGGGPAAALAAGLAALAALDAAALDAAAPAGRAAGSTSRRVAEVVVVLAADVPFLRPQDVQRLVLATADAAGAVLADATGAPQWLVGAWRAAVLLPALAGVRGGSLRAVLAPLAPRGLPGVPAAGEPPPWYDCDTAADLHQAAVWARARGGNGGGNVNPLEQWLSDVVDALGIGDAWSAADRDLVLDLARDVAHGVARPAAPLTTYLAGIAVGRGIDPADAARRIAALVPEPATD